MEASPKKPTDLLLPPHLELVEGKANGALTEEEVGEVLDYWEANGSAGRAAFPIEHLLRFESRQWLRDGFALTGDVLRRLPADPEKEEFLLDMGEVYKEKIDREFTEDGFSIESVEMVRSDNKTTYPNTVLYREGDRYPERTLVLSHGFTAGYESHAALIGSELRDFTLLIHNRPGVEDQNQRIINANHDSEIRFYDAMATQRQAAEIAIERGAKEIVLGGHSHSGQITVANLHASKLWSPEFRETLIGSVLLNSPSERDATKNSVIGRLMLPTYPVLKAWADRPGAEESVIGESVARRLASSVIVDRMIGEITDERGKEIYLASKYRAHTTNWRSLVYDTGALRSAPECTSTDQLLGLYHFIAEGTEDRLVMPPAGSLLKKQLSTRRQTGRPNIVHKKYRAGHFPHASHPETVNHDIHEFLENIPERR